MIEDENLKYLFPEDIFILKEEGIEYKPEESVMAIAEEPAREAKAPSEKTPAPVKEIHKSPKIPSIEKPKEEPAHELLVLVLPMNSKDKLLLTNLLKAINKKEADITLVNSFSAFTGNFKKLLSFGYHNELKHQLDAALEVHKCTKLGEKEILITYPLSLLHDNKAEKGALWKCLQEMFL